MALSGFFNTTRKCIKQTDLHSWGLSVAASLKGVTAIPRASHPRPKTIGVFLRCAWVCDWLPALCFLTSHADGTDTYIHTHKPLRSAAPAPGTTAAFMQKQHRRHARDARGERRPAVKMIILCKVERGSSACWNVLDSRSPKSIPHNHAAFNDCRETYIHINMDFINTFGWKRFCMDC